jgi:hypothetical protein
MPDASSNKQPPAGDDRNLVIVDEDFVNADAEDRLWLFWERNKGAIVRGTTALVVGILAFLAYYFWNEARKEAIGEEYTACQDESARRAFAGRHAGEPLAALALAEVGDDLKKAGKFAEAAKAYDEATRLAGLAGKSPAVLALGARTRLYSALARQEAGEAGAEAAIAAVADDTNAPETLRGFAMLTLANTAVAKGDTATATKWLNAMDKRLRAGHVWKGDKDSLVQSEPSLIAPATPAAK